MPNIRISSGYLLTLCICLFVLGLETVKALDEKEIEEIWQETQKEVSEILGQTPPEEGEVEFWLFTRNNPDTPQAISCDNIKETNFNPNVETKIITHGWMDGMERSTHQKKTKDEFLKHFDYNIILCDWSKAGSKAMYNAAVVATYRVSYDIAKLSLSLTKNGQSWDSIHLIGHSLGAQISANAGHYTGGIIGRVTAIDPAGPLMENFEERHRVSPDDAVFVDVLHTDGGGAGMKIPCGHVDFYPNGGSKPQPGCKEFAQAHKDEFKAMEATGFKMMCDHMLANEMFRRTIGPDSPRCVGHLCDSWESFNEGKCSECTDTTCASMGLPAIEYAPFVADNPGFKSFYYKTNPDPNANFCPF